MSWSWSGQWLEIIILRSPEKGVPWKFWLDPRFSRDPKIKWILKWPPLDRGYFKVYFFTKGESLLIISCHTYLSTHKFVIFLSHICIVMHFILIKLSRNSLLLIDDPLKRGDMEALARSLIFPSSQVRNEA